MNKGLTRWLVLSVIFMFCLFNLLYLQASVANAAGVYGQVPGKWSLNKKGFRDEFVPTFGYGKGVYAVKGLYADVLLALDTDGEGFAECKRVSEGHDVAQPIPDPSCGPQGPICTSLPYKCSSELVRPLFIATNIMPSSSERLRWTNSDNPTPAFKPLKTPAKGIRSFYFERSSKPRALEGKTLFHGAWLSGPNEFNPGADESYPTSVYDHYGRALYFRETSGIKFLTEPSIDFIEASVFEPVMKDKYQWKGAAGSTTYHDQPQYYPFNKIYTVPGGYWLEIDWLADFEGAGATTHTLILQIIDGKVSVLATAQETRMY